MKIEPEKTVPVSCNRDCGAGCPLLARIRTGRIVKVTDNPLRDAHMRGCIRGYQMPRTVYAADRLKTPLLRAGARGSGQFKEISWKEALDRIADKLWEIRDRYGCFAVLPFDGSGSCRGAVHHTGLLARRFFGLYGGFTARHGSYSSAAAAFAEKYVFGTRTVGFDAPTLAHSKLIILWGANICDTRFSARIESIILERKKAGIPIVAVDPRRSTTVKKLATRWIPICPGTDTALMAALLYVLITDNRLDSQFLDAYTIGFEDLAAYVLGKSDGVPKTPRWAQALCGVSARHITDLAGLYAAAKPAALLPGLSIQRSLGGEETFRFAAALQAATGNTGKVGGSSGGEFWEALPVPFFPRMPVPDTSELPVIPVYRWPDAVIEGTAGGYPADIKAIYNTGTNFLNQGSDIKKNIRAFEKVDLAVTHDLFLTPTACFSDVVLPVTTFLERDDVVFPADNFLFYSGKAVEPLHAARNDYDIFCELAERLGFGQAFSQGRTAGQWLDRFLAESAVDDIDAFKKTGIFRGTGHMRVALKEFIDDPLANPLNTPSGKIEIRSEEFSRTGFSPVPECRISTPLPEYPLRLITPHSKYQVNSQNANLSWKNALEAPVLEMNLHDAKTRGLCQGDRVRIASPVGAMEIGIRLTRDIIPGIVCLHQGAWTARDARGVETGCCANMLTSTIPTLPSQGSRTHTVFVQVEKV
jgi:anaerobic dimethyl sulfoxide reductase subunit A